MWRFAAGITVAEILLTVLSATLLTLEVEPDPYITRDDLRELALPCESHDTQRRTRFEAPLGFDSNFILEHPRQSVWVGVRVDQSKDDYAARRRREENWATKSGFGTSMILDDPGIGDTGYAVRHRNSSDVRCELVRFRGDRMVVVKVSCPVSVAGPDEGLATCERRARLLQGKILMKLNWWAPIRPTAAPR